MWADEVPPEAITEAELEAFFCACALHLGSPNLQPDPDSLAEAIARGDSSSAFHKFFSTYFPDKKPGAFTYIHYIIWYERESLKAESSSSPVQKTDSR